MWKILVRRLIALPLTLLLLTFIVFLLQALIPGGPAQAIGGTNATPSELAAISRTLGLNHPFMVRYWSFVVGALHGSLGTSYATRQPVTSVISHRLTPTVELVVGTFLLATVIGGAIGVWSAIRRTKPDGRIVLALTGIGLAVPEFWLAGVAAGILGLYLKLVPAVGFVPPSAGPWSNLHSVILPIGVLSLASGALVCRQTRSAMGTELQSPHVRSAWAMGLSPRRVYAEYALRNALAPLVTYLPLVVAGLVGATVVVEDVFNIPGIGSAIVAAIQGRDYPTLQGITLCLAVLVVALNLIADLLLMALDPRLRKA